MVAPNPPDYPDIRQTWNLPRFCGVLLFNLLSRGFTPGLLSLRSLPVGWAEARSRSTDVLATCIGQGIGQILILDFIGARVSTKVHLNSVIQGYA
jgi:hypothetical protein